MLLTAVVTWIGVGSGRILPAGGMLLAAAVAASVVLARRRMTFWVVVLLVGLASGFASQARDHAVGQAWVPDGPISMEVGVLAGPYPFGDAHRYVVRPGSLGSSVWRGPPVAVVFESATDARVGDVLLVHGSMRPEPTHVRGRPVSGTLQVDDYVRTRESSNPFIRVGNAVRARVMDATAGGGPGRSLVAGFLIGDTGGVAAADIEAMRQAGLSHFVAVSGSNVALFLAGWWMVTLPLSLNSRLRAWLGFAALGVFVIATRWEPSVVRASGMAALVLAGRLVTWPVDRWMALGITVVCVLLVSPELSGALGFQLSVAATAGVMASPRPDRRPVWLWSTLYVTLGAQLAVAPLLLRLGTIPLLAPMANLLAAPLVTLSTTIAMVGVLIGSEFLVGVAAWFADRVLGVAWVVFGGPQLTSLGLVAVLAGGLAMRSVRVRPLVVAVVVVGLTLGRPSGRSPRHPTVVFVDVGQGDSTILLGPGGEVVLIDGGPDPVGALRELSSRSVTSVDLMIVSHLHADHVTGLVPVISAFPVGSLWHSGHPNAVGPYEELLEEAAAFGIQIRVPPVGTIEHIGPFSFEVIGPLRRYKNPNDQSLVVKVSVGERSVLFTGDVEIVAQSELQPVNADVLKVPHQGAATSDPDWLVAIGSKVAIIPVGNNAYGHPSTDIIAALDSAGTEVLRTDLNGDITLTFAQHGLEWDVDRCDEPGCPPFD